MRAYEIITEGRRSPKISLRHINKLKRTKLTRQKKQDQKLALYAVMYSTPADQLHYLDVQKGRLEIAQQKADLALTQAETAQVNKEAVTKMARSGIETRHAKLEKMKAMAMRGLNRRNKS